MTSVDKEEILSFLHKNPMGVLSTVHKSTGAPDSAAVAFAETPDLEIIFQTFTSGRKYENLKHDPQISFVTGWQTAKHRQITFQYEGIVRELASGNSEYRDYRTLFDKKETPCTSDFLDSPDSRLFLISPVWFRYSDYTKDNPRIIEAKYCRETIDASAI